MITRGMTTLPRSKKNQPDSIISDGDWYYLSADPPGSGIPLGVFASGLLGLRLA